ncbi:DUF1826 domain-containing protein [Motilimonas pumila]|uniref:DUF1826 domain-containing protein n=2 Tax=Motilimonas pumila TaxID=2303987 RepID=A0A418YF09_9GAMM|nr:DUF1826 domain-containing protein [Motilimonas pumila]
MNRKAPAPIAPAAINSIQQTIKQRRASSGIDPATLTDIYQEDVNMAIWQRTLPPSLTATVAAFVASQPHFQASMTVSPSTALGSIQEAFSDSALDEVSANIAELVDMFCCLFELERVGLRLTVLERAMCPKFHVDKVPCRLVTTFQGVATQWLHHQDVNRAKLGMASIGLTDSESGIYQQQTDIQSLRCGDVALLKGERWQGNENAGLVHRSPAIDSSESRLLLTLDFID